METAARMTVLLLLLASVASARFRPLRALSEERRVLLLAAAAIFDLLLLQFAGGSLADFILGLNSLPAHAALAGLAAAATAAFALGLAWSVIFDDSSRRASRWILVVSAALALFLCGISAPHWATPALVIALRTGWARPVPRRFAPIAATFIGLVALIAWPALPLRDVCWPPACDLGLPLLRFARIFLGIQLGLIAVKLTFGLMFGPRRIGRRLLVSHLVAGIVPAALTGIFMILVALLAIAHVRTSLAIRLIEAQHQVSDQVLARCTDRALQECGQAAAQTPEPSALAALAVEIARRWPLEASWCPVEQRGLGISTDSLACARRFVCLSVAGSDPALSQSVLVRVPRPGAGAEDAVHWVCDDAGIEVSRSAGAADSAFFSRIPPPRAWAARPPSGGGSGLVKALGNTFHAADHRAAGEAGTLRVQLIEQLPYGRSRLFEGLLDQAVRIEETMRYTPHAPRAARAEPETGAAETASGTVGPGGASGTGGTGEAGGGADDAEDRERALVRLENLIPTSGFDISFDGLASTPPDPASSRWATYQPSPLAQEWLSGESNPWHEIRMSIVGISRLGDLIPPFPQISQNLPAYVPLIMLIFTALLFILVQTIMLILVARTGRAIADAVGDLRIGTEHLRRGDLSHRIPVHGVDELSTLGTAFNSMAEGLEEAQRVALEKERLESELELARQIQLQLLPAEAPRLPGYQISGFSAPARQVGGDYFDFLPLNRDRLFFVLADVAGKGAAAAILMSGVRAALHSIPLEQEPLPLVAQRLNEFIHRSTRLSEFVTLFMAILDRGTGEIRYVNAGQDQPFLMRASGTVERLATGGLVLGAFGEVRYEEGVATLAGGDLLVLYTDGLTEAVDPAGEMFGEQRLLALVPALIPVTAQEALGMILGRLSDFTQDAEAADDITLMAIRRE